MSVQHDKFVLIYRPLLADGRSEYPPPPYNFTCTVMVVHN